MLKKISLNQITVRKEGKIQVMSLFILAEYYNSISKTKTFLVKRIKRKRNCYSRVLFPNNNINKPHFI